MADNVHVRPVRQGDVEHVAAAMRQADQDEAALRGYAPLDALQFSVEASRGTVWTVEIAGEAAALFGVCAFAAGLASPWMLCTDRVTTHAMGVARRARRIVAVWARDCALANWCDARNTAAIAFIAWLGFTVRQTSREYVYFSMPQAVR